METVTVVRDFVVSTFAAGKNSVTISDEMSLIETGIIDSLGILKMLSFIEERFGIKVPEYDVVPDHFDTITVIAEYIDKHKG